MYKRSKRTYKRRRSTKKYSKRRTAYVPKKVKRYVRRAIANQAENKRASHTTEEKAYTNLMDQAGVNTLLPSISQGTGQGNRIGNRLKLKRAMLRFSITSFAGSANAHYADVYIYRLKSAVTAPNLAQLQTFLQNGNSTTWYDGDAIDGLRDVNSDTFTLFKHKRFVLSSLTSGTAGVANGSIPPTRTWKQDITKYYKKTWIYEDATSVLPSNVGLYMSVAGTDMAGLYLGSYGEYNMCIEFEFEDS